MKNARNWTERNAVYSFFHWKSDDLEILAFAHTPPPRYLSIYLTLLENNVTWSTEIWLYEPAAIKENRIKNIWKEALLYNVHQTACCLHETSFLIVNGLDLYMRERDQSGSVGCWIQRPLMVIPGYISCWKFKKCNNIMSVTRDKLRLLLGRGKRGIGNSNTIIIQYFAIKMAPNNTITTHITMMHQSWCNTMYYNTAH